MGPDPKLRHRSRLGRACPTRGGRRSEKLSEDERQLAFEDPQIAVAETEEQKQDQSFGEAPPKRKRVAKSNCGNLPEDLPRIEQVDESDSLVCPCGCGPMHKIGEAAPTGWPSCPRNCV
ncbi:transposase [Sulfitobacter sp. W002]|uniref:transposase n=1 Tax=Sulfitobacter sp. W002 TaxID=2867024 RepID=UPI0021A2A6AD|nr:transposase [Sulfitobacter sp. W002]